MAIVLVNIELVNDNNHTLIVQPSSTYIEDGLPIVVSPNVTIIDEDGGPFTYTALNVQVTCKSSL